MGIFWKVVLVKFAQIESALTKELVYVVATTIPVTRLFKQWYESWHKILELKALLAQQGGNKLKIFGAGKRICHIFVASMIPVTRISSDDMKVGTRLMGHFWALFERKCENEGRKTQSQARIMGYGIFREPTLWQHCRCPLCIEKSEFYSESYNNDSQIWAPMVDISLSFRSVREVM